VIIQKVNNAGESVVIPAYLCDILRVLFCVFITGSLRVLSPVSGVAWFSAEPRQKVYRPEVCAAGKSSHVWHSVSLVCSVYVFVIGVTTFRW